MLLPPPRERANHCEHRAGAWHERRLGQVALTLHGFSGCVAARASVALPYHDEAARRVASYRRSELCVRRVGVDLELAPVRRGGRSGARFAEHSSTNAAETSEEQPNSLQVSPRS